MIWDGAELSSGEAHHVLGVGLLSFVYRTVRNFRVLDWVLVRL